MLNHFYENRIFGFRPYDGKIPFFKFKDYDSWFLKRADKHLLVDLLFCFYTPA